MCQLTSEDIKHQLILIIISYTEGHDLVDCGLVKCSVTGYVLLLGFVNYLSLCFYLVNVAPVGLLGFSLVSHRAAKNYKE